MNRVAVLGSTGSIGTQTLAVARRLRGQVEVAALAAGRNHELLSRQLAEFHPRLYHTLGPELADPGGAAFASLEQIASDPAVDTVVIATSGRAGLEPTLAALRHGKRVALASKEVLVMAGPLVKEASRCPDADLVPIDSEHSAIWQCLQGERNGISRLVLTASGGPFREYSPERLEHITAADALAHPVWSMGAKITIDSATLMNKGLEVLEARWLFDVPLERIEVVVHPECIVHSMVEFVDGCVKAQMSVPDMALPIQYALTHPDRMPAPNEFLQWNAPRTLTFAPVDADRFPCLSLAREAGVAGDGYPAVLCGADEAAVALFLRNRIRFIDIPAAVERALASYAGSHTVDLDAILAAYEWGRDRVMNAPGTSVDSRGR